MKVLESDFIFVNPEMFSVLEEKSWGSNTSHGAIDPCARVRMQRKQEM